MIAKRELSAQQVSAYLLGDPNRYTPESFDNVYWSQLLRSAAPGVFAVQQEKDSDAPEESDPSVLLRTDGYTSEGELAEPLESSLLHDLVYRPAELNDCSLWEIARDYKKATLKSQGGSESSKGKALKFMDEHPQALTHAYFRRTKPIIPVIIGQSFPRKDVEEHRIKYAACVLVLFKPMRRDMDQPLLENGQTLCEALDICLSNLSSDLHVILSNTQQAWQCRDSKDDYSGQRRARQSQLMAEAFERGHVDLHSADRYAQVEYWQMNQLHIGVDGGDDADPPWEQDSPTLSPIHVHLQAAGFYPHSDQNTASGDVLRRSTG